MVQVLEPLKVRDCDTTSVDVKIGNNQDVALDKNLVSSGGGGSVSSFGDDLQNTILVLFFLYSFPYYRVPWLGFCGHSAC